MSHKGRWCHRIGGVLVAVALVLLGTKTARAQDCSPLLDMLQQGYSNGQIAWVSGLSAFQVQRCRRLLSQPIFIGPEGMTPTEAVGPSPSRAAGPVAFAPAGPPPIAAAGPPPIAAAGPSPINAAGRSPVGAAGRSPVGHFVRRLQ